MAPYIGEFVGMTLVITLGTSVVANVVLSNTKGQNSGSGAIRAIKRFR